ncbi:MAG: hypothetical protein IH975_08225 [Nitrospinae bacterium]|nr:hypothetical protein [Nitrospinota bacterium]
MVPRADQAEMNYKGLKIEGEESLISVVYSGSIKSQKIQWTISGIKVLPEHHTASKEYRHLAPPFTQVDMIGYYQPKEYPDEERQIRERILKECVSITEAMIRKADLLIKKNEQILKEIEQIKSQAKAKGL